MLKLGIPEYRLPRSVVEAQVREILESGDITLRLNQAAGRDFTISGLRQQGFDAVVIAVGAHRSRDLSIPGVDLDGVHKGHRFSAQRQPRLSLHHRQESGRHRRRQCSDGRGPVRCARSAAAARRGVPRGRRSQRRQCRRACAAHEMVDVSLSALRLGAQEVGIVCLEKRQEMPAALEEIEEAETEGIVLHDGRGPHRVLGRDGKVIGLETLKTKCVSSTPNGRFNPAFVREQRIRHRVRHRHPGHRPGAQPRFPASRKMASEVSPRGLIVARPRNSDDHRAGSLRRRRLRVRPAPDHRQRGRRQAHRDRHRRVSHRAQASRTRRLWSKCSTTTTCSRTT